jgi:hypothetical protein
MKTIYLILITFICVQLSCTKASEKEELPNLLVGKWELYEIFVSDGANSDWITPPEIMYHSLNFYNNGEYLFLIEPAECQNGNYTFTEESIFLSPDSNNCTSGNISYYFRSEDLLELIEENNSCVEICSKRYIRIDNK